jgi:hypothetical protein
MSLGHDLVGGFDVAAQASGIEQRSGGAIDLELAPDGPQQVAIGRKLAGQRFVFFEAIGHELG